jgi:hypothetical protein
MPAAQSASMEEILKQLARDSGEVELMEWQLGLPAALRDAIRQEAGLDEGLLSFCHPHSRCGESL